MADIVSLPSLQIQTPFGNSIFESMSIRKRLYFLLILIFMVITAGSTGYYIIFDGEPAFLDCLYRNNSDCMGAVGQIAKAKDLF